MRVQDSPTITEVPTDEQSDQLSPRAKVVFDYITKQLDECIRNKWGSCSVDVDCGQEALDEAARAFQADGWSTYVRYHPGFLSKKNGVMSTLNEEYALEVWQ